MNHLIVDPQHLLEPGSLAWAVFFGVLVLGLASIAVMLVRRVARRVERDLSDTTVLRFASVFVQLLIYLIAFALYAHLVPQLHALGTALLAGASITSVIMGLAARDTLGNLVAGCWLVLTRTIQIGDSIRLYCPVGIISARVEAISLAFSLLIDGDGNEVIVPNNMMMGSAVVRVRTKGSVASPTPPSA